MEEIKTKWCSKGQHTVSLDGFSKNRRSKDGLCVWCKECTKSYARHYFQLNKLGHSSRMKAYREANRDKLLNKKRAYWETTRDRQLKKKKAYFEANKEKVLATQRDYRARNLSERRSKNREHAKRFRENHPERYRASHRINKAKRMAAPGKFTARQWLSKIEYHGWRCIYCKASLTSKTIHMDHRKPLARSGSNWPANLAPACQRCNTSKGAKHEAEFRKQLVCNQTLKVA